MWIWPVALPQTLMFNPSLYYFLISLTPHCPHGVPLSSFFFLYPVTISLYRSNAPLIFPRTFCSCSNILSWDYHKKYIKQITDWCAFPLYGKKPTTLLQTAVNNGGHSGHLWESSSQIFGTGQMLLGCSLGHSAVFLIYCSETITGS